MVSIKDILMNWGFLWVFSFSTLFLLGFNWAMFLTLLALGLYVIGGFHVLVDKK